MDLNDFAGVVVAAAVAVVVAAVVVVVVVVGDPSAGHLNPWIC